MSIRLRIVVGSLAVLVAVLGMTVAGYVYINRVAADVGRVPVMFVVSPAPAAPR